MLITISFPYYYVANIFICFQNIKMKEVGQNRFNFFKATTYLRNNEGTGENQ
jgi:hypothetical protein